MRQKHKAKFAKTDRPSDAVKTVTGAWIEVALQIISGNDTKLSAAIKNYSRTLEKTRKQFGIETKPEELKP